MSKRSHWFSSLGEDDELAFVSSVTSEDLRHPHKDAGAEGEEKEKEEEEGLQYS